MTGELTFYDKPSAWGLIFGEDGRLYVVLGSQVVGPTPRVNQRVVFEPMITDRGLRALGVRTLQAASAG